MTRPHDPLPDNAIRKIMIVGGGTAGWMVAAGLSKLLNHPDVEIGLIESESIGTVGVGEATIPHIRYFNELLGLDEDEFVRKTQATFKLGIEFNDWGHLGESYFHSFGQYGVGMEGLRFQHFWLRHAEMMKERGGAPSIDAYNLQVMAAYAGKFQRPAQIRNSPLASIAYAFQFDAASYARFMREFAEARGVVRTEGRVVDVARDAETGHVASVTLEDGSTHAAEFFIDCSGFRGLLIEQALETGYDDWSSVLPCNRAVAQACESVGEPKPFTRATAKAAGWQWRIPLQTRTGNGHVYCDEYISNDEAYATLRDGMDGEPIGEPNFLRFKTGIRKQVWNRNVLSIGLAAGFLEPLESTSIHLIQTSVARLMAHFPDRTFARANIDYFNQRTRLEYEQVRDFLVLHYCVTRRDDTPFWDYCRTMDIPAELAQRIAVYQDSGRTYRHDNEIFGEWSWFAVMHGQGLVPRSYHPMADIMPDATLEQKLAQMRQVWQGCLDSMPMHTDFIDRHCRTDVEPATAAMTPERMRA